MKRRHLTDREKIAMVERQQYLCALCGGPLMPCNTEYDPAMLWQPIEPPAAAPEPPATKEPGQ